MLVGAAADADHHLREAPGVHLALHEAARAHFDIQHQCVQADRQLLRHDGRSNQRNGFDGSGGVTQRVKPGVGGRDLRRLPDESQAVLRQLLAEFVEGKIGAETGNGFEFIERAAGVAQGAAGNHRHDDAGGRGERRRNQTGFVADAAGRVLIDFKARDRRKIHLFAGLHHAFGEDADFAVGHAGEKYRH